MSYKDLEKKRAYMKAYRKKRKRELRAEIFDKLGPICVRCGFDDLRALQIDHIQGNGAKRRKRATERRNYYYGILRDLSSHQILCANCNTIKSVEEHEQPQPIDTKEEAIQ